MCTNVQIKEKRERRKESQNNNITVSLTGNGSRQGRRVIVVRYRCENEMRGKYF
jgi:hypothetical protein